MRWEQYFWLGRKYRIVMWDLVTRDYSTRLNGRDVLNNVKRLARPGSIITFHDSLKSQDKLLYALPRAIAWLQEQGYAFKVFPPADLKSSAADPKNTSATSEKPTCRL